MDESSLADETRAVIDELQKRGASVKYGISTEDGYMLTFEGAKFGDEDMRLAAQLPNVDVVTLITTAITAKGFRELLNHDRLYGLSISGSDLEDAAVNTICELHTLGSLDLQYSRFNPTTLEKHLPALRQLVDLDLPDTQVGDNVMSSIGKLANLQRLSLNNTRVTDAGLQHLLVAKSIDGVDLANCEISDEGLNILSQIAALHSLTLRGTSITDEGLRRLQACKKLYYLDIDNTRVTMAGLRELSNLRKLHDVRTKGTSITEAELDRFLDELRTSWSEQAARVKDKGGKWEYIDEKLTKAKVALEGPAFEDVDIVYLSRGWATVVSLSLAGSTVTDKGLKNFEITPQQKALLQKLQELDLTKTQVTADGLSVLAGARRLVKLRLDECPVSNEGMRHLAKLQRLECLSLRSTGIDDAGLLELITLHQLREIDLRGTKVSSNGVRRLREAIPAITIKTDDDV